MVLPKSQTAADKPNSSPMLTSEKTSWAEGTENVGVYVFYDLFKWTVQKQLHTSDIKSLGWAYIECIYSDLVYFLSQTQSPSSNYTLCDPQAFLYLY